MLPPYREFRISLIGSSTRTSVEALGRWVDEAGLEEAAEKFKEGQKGQLENRQMNSVSGALVCDKKESQYLEPRMDNNFKQL